MFCVTPASLAATVSPNEFIVQFMLKRALCWLTALSSLFLFPSNILVLWATIALTRPFIDQIRKGIAACVSLMKAQGIHVPGC